MPSISSNQAMGQYRYDKSYKYITNKVTFGPSSKGVTYDLTPVYRTQGDSIMFRNVQIPLEKESYKIKYGTTYYLHLELPQHVQYTTMVKIKLCAMNNNNDINNASLVNFQTIRELIIPPAPPIADQEAIESIILYEDPLLEKDPPQGESSPKNTIYQADIVYDWPNGNNVLWKPNNVYKIERSDKNIYYKSGNESQPNLDDNIEDSDNIIKNYTLGRIEKKWLTANSSKSIASFDIVFSPSYNLIDGYSFILLEIDRSGGYQTQIQYIGEDGETYYGTYMELADVTGEFYQVSNLLKGSTPNSIIDAPIKSVSSTLNHIAVWSHPELLLAINGEEIKVGQTNFYELDDFTITSLGVVAKNTSDRFTIDYQYEIN